LINIFAKHPLTTNAEEQINEMTRSYENEFNARKNKVEQVFTSIREQIDARERSFAEKFADADVQNRKKLEDYQNEFIKKCQQVKERRLLLLQRIANGDFLNILIHFGDYTEYLTKMLNEWMEMKIPQFIEINIDGLDQFHEVLQQAIEKVHVVEQEPYENQQLQDYIDQQNNASTLNLNNQNISDLDTIVVAKKLANNTVRFIFNRIFFDCYSI